MFQCEELNKLTAMLEEQNIEWVDDTDRGFMTIERVRFTYAGHTWSAINGFGTYGGLSGSIGSVPGYTNAGLIELAEIVEPDRADVIAGWLSAAGVMDVIEAYVAELEARDE